VTGRIVPLETDPHVAVQSLLPWYATGRLDETERALVDEHLAQCEECRAELVTEQQWRRLQATSGAQVDVEAGWSAMLAKLGEGDAERVAARRPDTARRVPPRLRRPVGWGSAGPLLRWGWTVPTVAAAAAVLVLGVHGGFGGDSSPGRSTVALNTPADASYHALAAASAPTAAALVRFRADATEADIRAVLQRFDARIVDGPTASDAWVVRLPRAHYGDALSALRAQPAVTLAEALESEGTR
jgi:anti-sigma factor RsiW